MPAIGFGLAWLGYSVALLGWCKVKGYTVGMGDLVRPSKAFVWPPPGGAATTATTAATAIPNTPTTSSSGTLNA